MPRAHVRFAFPALVGTDRHSQGPSHSRGSDCVQPLYQENGADTSGYAFQWAKRQRSRPTSLRAHDSRSIRGCMEALLVAADFTTVKTVRDRTDITEFDHCLPHLKGSDAGKSGTYTVGPYPAG